MKQPKSLLAVGCLMLAIVVSPLRSGEQKGRNQCTQPEKINIQKATDCSEQETNKALEACTSPPKENNQIG